MAIRMWVCQRKRHYTAPAKWVDDKEHGIIAAAGKNHLTEALLGAAEEYAMWSVPF